MGDQPTQRRLVAVLAADVAGYTRLMEQDTDGTVAAWQAARREVIKPMVADHSGKIVKLTGDGFLVEFSTIQDAVNCAIAMQRGLASSSLDFRMGVNLGDIVDDGEDIHGEGVNVAARLEGLADPGCICISGDVYNQIRNRVDANFEDMGRQEVKNVSAPVQVYAVRLDGSAAPSTSVAPAISDKPSIAVLPFDNLSGDPDQEYFADGMTEDIITGLSRFRSLFVIARNSTIAYKGQSPDVREVARDLGVRYVLEGSVRRSGERIRITGQLIDAETGNHLWAERYDRKLEDIFAVQDEVTEAIVATIAPEIGGVELERSQRRPPESLDAWDIYQRGLAAYYSSTEERLRSAIEKFDRVNEIDPTFAPAFAMAANARVRYLMHFMPDNHSELLNQAREKAHKGITLDPRDPTCLWVDGRVLSTLGQHDVAISKIEEAIALNPNDAMSHHMLGLVLCRAGRPKEAIPHIDHAIRLSPRDIWLTGFLGFRAFVLFDLERYEEAFECARRASLSPNPRAMTFALLTAVLTRLGRPEEARAALGDLLAHTPGISSVNYRENPWGGPEVTERFVNALREAGLSE
jgi:adenylate cyclase